MFLHTYQDVTFNGIDINSQYSGILWLGVNHRKRYKYGLVCCPGCLSDKIPYYKKEWRLFYSLICLKCNCHLIDRCPKCLHPISFHRLETGHKNNILNKPLYTCYNCFYDLRKGFKKVYKNSELSLYQSYINDTIKRGFNNITQYSFLFFQLFYYMNSRLFTKSKYWDRIKFGVQNQLNYKFDSNIDIKNNIAIRKEALTSTYKYFKDWPNNFISLLKESNIRYSDFSKDLDSPFLLYKILMNNS